MALPTEKTKKEPNYLRKTYLIYGAPKVGKTTTIANLGDDKHKIVFFTTEPGHKFQEIYKYTTNAGQDPSSWIHFCECAKELITAQHDFAAIAIDIADDLFGWCADFVNKKAGIDHESDAGFGKGYAAIRKEFIRPIQALTAKGIGIIFVSHEKTTDKDMGRKKVSYTDTTLPGTAAKLIHGLSDYILYLHSDVDGKRYIRTKGTEHFNAGDRSGLLPDQIEMRAEILKQHLIKN